MNDIVFLEEFFTNYESIEWPKEMGVPAVIFESTFWLTEPTALVHCWQVNMKIPACGEISFD